MRRVCKTTLCDVFVLWISLMELPYNPQDSSPAGKSCLNSEKQIPFLIGLVSLHLVA